MNGPHISTASSHLPRRAFLRGMGGGCQSPVGALAEVEGERLILRAVSFLNNTVQRSELTSKVREPAALGEAMAAELGA